MHRLMDPPAGRDKPVVDRAEFGDHHTADAGLLGDLPYCGLDPALALLDVSLGKRPHQAARAITLSNQDRTCFWPASVHDQTAGRRLVDRRHPAMSSPPIRPWHATDANQPGTPPVCVATLHTLSTRRGPRVCRAISRPSGSVEEPGAGPAGPG